MTERLNTSQYLLKLRIFLKKGMGQKEKGVLETKRAFRNSERKKSSINN